MERETKVIETKSGNKIVIKTYLTGREANSIKEELYKSFKFNVSSKETGLDGDVTGEMALNQEKKLLSVIVVSVNGKTEGILDLLLDMHNDEYQQIVSEVNAVFSGNLAPAK